MQIIILDTEYTSWEGSLQRNWGHPEEHREIVQIAAIIIETCDLLELDYCSILTKPKINPILSNYFVNLTGVTNEMMEQSKFFNEGMKEYRRFVGNRPVYACGDEGEIIKENLHLYGITDFLELTKVANLRPWFCKNGLNAKIIASGELHKHLGIELNGSAHNALHDVRSILVSIDYLVKNGAPHPFDL